MARAPKPWFRKDRNAWFVTIAGKRHNLGKDRALAFQRFHQLMAEPQKQAVRSDSVAALIDLYLEWLQKNRSAGTYNWYMHFCQSFINSIPANLQITDLKPFHVQEWLDARNDSSDSTKRGCITAVKRPFAWAEKQGYIDRSPIAHVEKPQEGRREQIVSSDELKKILSLAPDEPFQDVLHVAWEVGPRPQEIVNVEARHVDIKNARWVFPKEESKGKKHPRVIYLTDKALQITKRLLLKHPEGKLFRNVDGNPWKSTAINSRFVRLKVKLGKKYCLYLFRHSYATRLLEAGVDCLTVSMLLGHRDTNMLARVYSHLGLNPQHLREQAKRAAG